jgi:O-antigen/teichoic acid export membrane protein
MSFRQSFLFNTLFTLAVNLLVKPVWVFGIDRTVQNRLGEAEYGLFFAIFNFSYLFQIVLDFGLQNYNQTEIAADPTRLRKMLPGMLTVKLLMSFAYVLVVTFVGVSLGYAVESYFPWLLLNQVLLSLIIFLRSNISANRLFLRDALLSISDKILMIVGSVFMLAGTFSWLDLSIYHFVQIQTVALCITTILCFFSILHIQPVFDWEPDTAALKKILLDSLPFAAAYFLMTLYYRLDTVMIEQMLGSSGAQEAGIYAQSYRIMESINNLGYLMAGVLLPLFAYRLGLRMPFLKELRHGYGLMLTMAAPIISGGFFYAEDIIAALYPGRDAAYSAAIFRLLLLNFFPVAMLYVISPLLTANKSFRWMLSSLILAVAFNIGLNYWLIPLKGAWGAAFATLATQALMLMSYSIGMQKIFALNIPVQLIVKSALVVSGTVGCSVVVYGLNLHWLLGLSLIAIAALLLSLFSGLVSKAAFKLSVRE